MASQFDWDIHDVAMHLDTDKNNVRNIIFKRNKVTPGCIRHVERVNQGKRKNVFHAYNSAEIIQHFKDYPIRKKLSKNIDHDSYDRPAIAAETQLPYNQMAFNFLRSPPCNLSTPL